MDQDATGEIWGIYLAPLYWRKGIGTALCPYKERLLKKRRYRSATLWVFASNQQARRFYEAMGFKADGATRTLNLGAPLQAVRYRKALGVDIRFTRKTRFLSKIWLWQLKNRYGVISKS